LTFGAGPCDRGATLVAGAAIVRLPGADEERYDLARTRLAGRHNVENILAAALIARLAGAAPDAVQEAIDTAEPLPHRLALVAGPGWRSVTAYAGSTTRRRRTSGRR